MILRFFFLRELRKFPLFFILLTFTLLLGNLGLTGISIVSSEVQGKLQSRAHELLTSDFAVTARRELHPHEQEALDKIMQEFEHEKYQVIDIYSMVTHLEQKQSRLVEVRAIEEDFPFYGSITTDKGPLKVDGIIISKDLGDLWDVKVGDQIQVGELKLKVNGVVEEDSSLGLRGFSLAPRVYVSLDDIYKTGLLQPGATGSYAQHFLLPNLDKTKFDALKTRVYKELPDHGIKVVLPEDSSQQTGRVINILSNFMNLSALIGLVLSLVGVFYLYQSQLLARLKDLCLLNLHGLHKGVIILGIVAQFTGVFLLAFLLQVLALTPIYRFLLPKLSSNLGLELEGVLNVGAIASNLPYLYGLALFVLVPLLLGLMRTPMGLVLKSPRLTLGHFRFYDFFPFLGMLLIFSIHISHSPKVGNIFFACLLLVFVLSTALVRGMQWFLRRYVKGRGLLNPNLSAGIALRNLARSGHKLTLSFLSLCMGATLISLIMHLDHMIEREFTMDQNKPGLFIFDIQEDQVEELEAFAEQRGTPLEAVTPMIRARLEKVNGKKFERRKGARTFRDGREDDDEDRARRTGLNITYRDKPSASERIIKGRPFPAFDGNTDRPALVSLEKRWTERMGISMGDHLVFDVQGVEIEGVVHNIRDVKWTSFRPNFFVTMEPGFLDLAPKTFLAVFPSGQMEMKTEFQRAAVMKFPNISFIDVEELVSKLTVLFERSRQAIEIISMLSLLVGLVILYGLSHDQVYRRYYDLALMKTLGLSADRLRLNLVLEFGGLFMAALTMGIFLGWFIAQIIGIEVFKLSFEMDWGRMLVPGFSLTILCLATILIASWNAVRARPRELLSDT